MLHGVLFAAMVNCSPSQAPLLPPPDQLAVFKLTELLPAEADLLAIALSPLRWAERHRLLQPDKIIFGNKAWQVSRQNWYESLTTVAATRSLAFGPQDAAALRRHAYRHFDWEPPPVRRDFCLRPRCLLLRRIPSGPAGEKDGQRRMSNEDDVVAEMEAHGCGQGNVQRRHTSETMSLQQQAKVFASFDLIVASHSSQLVFLTWAAPQTTIIEVFPITVNADFGHIGTLLGLEYFFAWGGSVPGVSELPLEVERLVDAMNVCGGTIMCFRQTQLGNSARQKEQASSFFKTAAFSSAFTANVHAVTARLKDAERSREQNCQEHRVAI